MIGGAILAGMVSGAIQRDFGRRSTVEERRFSAA